MIHSPNCWNSFSSFISLWLLVSYFASILNASPRYPHVLPKCCEPDGISPDNRIYTKSNGSFDCHSQDAGLESILLPKQFFPGMSTETGFVKVEMRNMVEELQCEEGAVDLDILIDLKHLQTSARVNIQSTKHAFDDITFSGDNLLVSDGNIYTPPDFCIFNGTTNKTHLHLKTCKQTCSPQSPCIRRCCGGQQSILTSLPTSANKSILDFCSSPTLRYEWKGQPWNPWTSEVLSILNNETRFYQTKYAPHNLGVYDHSAQQQNCTLLAFTSLTENLLTLLEDGSLEVTQDGKREVLENFCIDGTKGNGVNSFEASEDKCAVSEGQEVVVVYVCSPKKTPSTPTPPFEKNDPINLPLCSCLANLTDKLIQCPLSYKADHKLKRLIQHPLVRLTIGENRGSLECPNGYFDFTLEYESKEPPSRRLTFFDGSVLFPFMVSDSKTIKKDKFCILSVFNNAMTVRICQAEKTKWGNLSSVLSVAMFIALFLSPLFYVVIAVVYILRKDKELILRCGTVCYAISMALCHVLLASRTFFRAYIDVPQSFLAKHFILEILMAFFSDYNFAWMCTLCFDLWLTTTFHCPGNQRILWLWGYIAFTLTVPAVFVGIFVSRVERFIDPNEGFSYVWDTWTYGLLSINCLLFLATAVKLWIGRHSSVRPQMKPFLYYSKLFLLMFLDSVIEHLTDFVHERHNKNFFSLELGLHILMLLHPIVSFFLLVWNEETQRYLATNYPCFKRALDFIVRIGYPVRKCLGFCRRCKISQDVGTNGDEMLETFLCSNDSHLHTRQDSDIHTLT